MQEVVLDGTGRNMVLLCPHCWALTLTLTLTPSTLDFTVPMFSFFFFSEQVPERSPRPNTPQEQAAPVLETRALRRVSRLEPWAVGHRRGDRPVLQAGSDGPSIVAESGPGDGGAWQLPGNQV